MQNKRSIARWMAACVIWVLASGPALAVVDANQAPPEDLVTIRGIGPATSQRMVEARQAQPFTDWPDLIARVRGIGPATARRLSDGGLRINGQPYGAPPSPSGPQDVRVPLWKPMVPRPLHDSR